MIKLHDFSIGYGERTLLCEVETTIEKGRLTALIGRNGTGKSTLLRAIAGLNRRYTGRILLDGHNAADMRAAEMARTLAFVTTERTRIANLKCKDVVAIGRAPYTNWIGKMQEVDKEIVMRSLASVGMEAYAERTICPTATNCVHCWHGWRMRKTSASFFPRTSWISPSRLPMR